MSWDEKLHPRGRDGKFIQKFGWVSWFANGRKNRGQVIGFADSGEVMVKGKDGVELQRASELASDRPPKALLPAPPKDEVPKIKPPPHSSMAAHMEKGRWTDERKQLHEQIVAAMTDGHPTSDSPTMVFMGGGPAAGKSTIIDQGFIQLPDDPVSVDPDWVKSQMPDYLEMTAAGDPTAAAYAHEESSWIARQGRAVALNEGMNVLLDGVGDSGFGRVSAKVADAHRRGYTVDAHYVTVSVEEAKRRNEARYAKTGRKVPDSFLEKAHRDVSRTVVEAIQHRLFDNLDVWDTETDDGVPVKIAEQHGDDFRVIDGERWARFVAKGGYDGLPDMSKIERPTVKPKSIFDLQPGREAVDTRTDELVTVTSPPGGKPPMVTAETIDDQGDPLTVYVPVDQLALPIGG